MEHTDFGGKVLFNQPARDDEWGKVIAEPIYHLSWWSDLLEGKNVNLRVMEKDDIDFCFEWFGRIDYYSEYDSIPIQKSKTERLKLFDNPSQLAILAERARFIIEKKDGSKIGSIRIGLFSPTSGWK